MRVLTPFQIEFIRLLAESKIQERFFLTGGTALSEFFLQHRYSDDLDFFTEEEGNIIPVLPVIEEINARLKGELEVKRNLRTFIEIFITRGKEILRCDFALDSPYRLAPTVLIPEYGIYIDNKLDISCNKLSALFDRYDPKDFVDIYFIDKEIIAFDKLLIEAKKKHIGLDEYWLAASLVKIEDFDVLPRLIKPISLAELRAFFMQKAEWLMTAGGLDTQSD